MELVLNTGNWNELKKKLRQEYPQLTESDMDHPEGKEEDMLRMVEYKLQKTKEEMREIIAGYSQF
jgi:hypothetical protein